MSNVFITNDAGQNFDMAAKFGTLVRCSSGKLNVFNPDKVAEQMLNALSTFTEEDFLLLSGGAMSMLFAGMYIPDHVKRLRLLVYDAKVQEYFVRTIAIGDTE